MNELNNPSLTAYSFSDSMAALVDTTHGHGDGNISVSSSPPIIRRTLKDRIKRNMAISLTSSTTSAASSSYSATSPNDPREELVLTAASALASLNNSQGGESVSGGGETRKEEHPTNATSASSVARNASTDDSTLLSGRMLMPSLMRPPPIVAPQSQLEIVEAESRLSRLSRPFASLLGSDIPLTFPQKVSNIILAL